MIRRPPRSTQSRSSAASDVYKRQATTTLRSWHAPGTPRIRTSTHNATESFRSGHLEGDDAVVVPPAAVHDRGPFALLVHEQEEIVPHQLHLVQRLVESHRPSGVALLADHKRAVPDHGDRAHLTLRGYRLLRRLGAVSRLRGHGREGFPHRDRGVSAVMDAPTVRSAAHL